MVGGSSPLCPECHIAVCFLFSTAEATVILARSWESRGWEWEFSLSLVFAPNIGRDKPGFPASHSEPPKLGERERQRQIERRGSKSYFWPQGIAVPLRA